MCFSVTPHFSEVAQDQGGCLLTVLTVSPLANSFSIRQSPNHQITRSPNHEITRSLRVLALLLDREHAGANLNRTGPRRLAWRDRIIHVSGSRPIPARGNRDPVGAGAGRPAAAVSRSDTDGAIPAAFFE